MSGLISSFMRASSIRLLPILVALSCACSFMVGCDESDDAMGADGDAPVAEDSSSLDTSSVEEPGIETLTTESSAMEGKGSNAISEPIIVTIENANELSSGEKIQVSALVSLLCISHDNNDATDFIVNLTGDKYDSYDIMGTIPIKYKQLTSDYPDIYAGLMQIGPDKRNYIMTVTGDFAGYHFDPETDDVSGFDVENCKMISLAPAE